MAQMHWPDVANGRQPDMMSPTNMARGFLKYYPYLATANLLFIFKEKGGKGPDDEPILGKVSKVSPVMQAAMKAYLPPDEDPPVFIITIGYDVWTEASEDVREAWIDFLLSQCHGEEDEKTGDIKYSVRKPSVLGSPEIITRHGTGWSIGLQKMSLRITGEYDGPGENTAEE